MSKKYKISFLCDTTKLTSSFMHRKFFLFNFYITHLQYLDLLCTGFRNKETFNQSFHVYSPARYMEAVTISCSGKNVFWLSRFNLCKTSVKGSYFSKIAGFPITFSKMNNVTGIFEGFYRDFKQFSIVCNIWRRYSNGRFCKF